MDQAWVLFLFCFLLFAFCWNEFDEIFSIHLSIYISVYTDKMVLAWAKDWVMDKVYGAAKTGIQAGGSMAGNAVGGVGSLVENSGRGLGQSTSGLFPPSVKERPG